MNTTRTLFETYLEAYRETLDWISEFDVPVGKGRLAVYEKDLEVLSAAIDPEKYRKLGSDHTRYGLSLIHI